jgi:hypothetical protein
MMTYALIWCVLTTAFTLWLVDRRVCEINARLDALCDHLGVKQTVKREHGGLTIHTQSGVKI